MVLRYCLVLSGRLDDRSDRQDHDRQTGCCAQMLLNSQPSGRHECSQQHVQSGSGETLRQQVLEWQERTEEGDGGVQSFAGVSGT